MRFQIQLTCESFLNCYRLFPDCSVNVTFLSHKSLFIAELEANIYEKYGIPGSGVFKGEIQN